MNFIDFKWTDLSLLLKLFFTSCVISICSGCLYFYLFNYTVLLELDIVKISMIALGLYFVLFVVWFAFIYISDVLVSIFFNTNPLKELPDLTMLLSTITSVFIFNLSIIIKYTFNTKLTHNFILLSSVLAILWFTLIIKTHKNMKKNNP
jgi:hypothetical protein